jgi:hypothetical protein
MQSSAYTAGAGILAEKKLLLILTARACFCLVHVTLDEQMVIEFV